MSVQEVLAWGTGTVFLLLLFAVAIVIYLRGTPVPREAMLILRVIISISGSGVAAVLPGFLEITSTSVVLAIRAGGAFAAFIVLYFFNPAGFVERKSVQIGPPQPRRVRRDTIEPNLAKKKSG